jgi:cytochrome c553
MRRIILCAALVLGLLGTAEAGPFADEMAKCLARKTTERDKYQLIKWLYAGMSLHPAVSSLANVTPAQRGALSREIAVLLTDILTVRCHEEAKSALTYEGNEALTASFRFFGESAMQAFVADANVSAYMEEFATFLKDEDFAALTSKENAQ